jgi:hypothetical protein
MLRNWKSPAEEGGERVVAESDDVAWLRSDWSQLVKKPTQARKAGKSTCSPAPSEWNVSALRCWTQCSVGGLLNTASETARDRISQDV